MLELRLLHDHHDLEAICGLFADVWHLDASNAPINAEVLRAFVHNDSYLCGAYVDGVLEGGSVGFWGRDDTGWLLHSHITGVRQDSTGNGLGFAMKQHQRSWVLAHGVARITWTFDPLIRRNAYFNLARVGAVVHEYHEAFYGEMRDPINTGDESDRCVAVWNLGEASERWTPPPVRVDDLHLDSVTILSSDSKDWPVVHNGSSSGAEVLRAYVPENIEALRRTDPQKALAWRRALRATFGVALRSGYATKTMSRDGWYTLQREP